MKEMTQQARVRRLQDTLIIAGGAVFAFSVWGVAKLFLFLILTEESKVRELLDVNDQLSMSVIYIVAGIAVLIDVCIRAYVGISARSEGLGKKKSPVYLVVAAIAAIGNAYSAITVVFGMSLSSSIYDAVISVIIEATALAALVLVIYCSVRLRRQNSAAG